MSGLVQAGLVCTFGDQYVREGDNQHAVLHFSFIFNFTKCF